MSETPENEIVEPEAVAGVEKIELPETPIPQAGSVILPVIMRRKDAISVLGEMIFTPEDNKMAVSLNTEDGREVAELIGSGMLTAISFNGHMSRAGQFNR